MMTEPPAAATLPTPRRDEGQPGTVVGYRIVRTIAVGGHGVVYEAIQESTGQRVALKQLRRGTLADESERRRFRQEIGLLAGLRHPHIVQVFHAAEVEGLPALAMEYIEGRPLVQFSRATGLSPRAVVEMFARLASALAHAHERGVIHRDLKPQNILVANDGNPKVLDFGVARLQGEERLTADGEFVGTWAYAAPEQLDANFGDIRQSTDVYSLGVVAYEALTGRLPHPLEVPPRERIREVCERVPAPPSSLAGGIDSELDAIVLRMLDKDPGRRYANGAELQRELGLYLGGQPVMARASDTGYRLRKYVARHRWKFLGASAAAAVVVIVALQSVRAGRDREQREMATAAADEVSRFLLEIVDVTGGASAARAPDPEAAIRGSVVRYLSYGVKRSEPVALATREKLGDAYRRMGFPDQAAHLVGVVLRERFERTGPRGLDLANTLHNFGLALLDLGHHPAARQCLDAAVALREGELQGDDEALLRARLDQARAVGAEGRHAIAFQRLVRLRSHLERGPAANPALLGDTDHALGVLMAGSQEWPRAIRLFESALVHRRTAGGDALTRANDTLERLGDAWLAVGRASDAEAAYLEVLAVRGRAYGERNIALAHPMVGLGRIAALEGRWEEAELYLRDALELLIWAHGREHLEVATAEAVLATVLEATGRTSEGSRLREHAAKVVQDFSRADASLLGRVTVDDLGMPWIAELLRSGSR